MPTNAFSLSIFVGRQNQTGGPLERVLKFFDYFLFALGNNVERIKVIVYINT